MHTLVKAPFMSEPMAVSNEQYHSGEGWKDFISSTSLKNYLTSPKDFLYKRLNGSSISLKASMEGNIVHDCFASLATVGDLSMVDNMYFIFEPPINQRTGEPFGITSKAYMESYNEALELNPGKSAIDKQTLETGKQIANSVISDSMVGHTIKGLLKIGKAEVSHAVEYKGDLYKYRPDLKTKQKIIDWKTLATDDLSDHRIQSEIISRKYDISAAFYQFFEHELTGKWKEFWWVFIQKKPPYDVRIVSANDWAFSVIRDKKEDMVELGPGALRLMKLLELHSWCKANDTYPGVSFFDSPDWKNHRIAEIPAPSYYKGEMFNYYTNENK